MSQTDRTLSAGDAGFSLIEMLCVLAIISMTAALVTPALRGRSAELSSISMATAAILKTDRNVALLSGKAIATRVDSSARVVTSGSVDRSVSVPVDVRMQTILPKQCEGRPESRAIRFFPNGLSCGGVIRFLKGDRQLEVRVNWLTGAVDIGSIND